MNRYYCLFLMLSCFTFYACSENKKPQNNKSQNKNAKIFKGEFAGDTLILEINDSHASNTVTGTSRHKGVAMDLSGNRDTSSKGYAYHLKELGTSTFQGVFDLEWDTSLNFVFGSWQKSDTTGGREVVLFTLQPQP